jgi:NTP pyrophosphatase (non-canonical NTP hydrolase)
MKNDSNSDFVKCDICNIYEIYLVTDSFGIESGLYCCSKQHHFCENCIDEDLMKKIIRYLKGATEIRLIPKHLCPICIKEGKINMGMNEIYQEQAKFEDMLIMKNKNWPDKPLADFDTKEQALFSKELALLLYQEVGEFVNAVGNYKMHKSQQDNSDPKEVREEISDMFIFVLDMALTHKMSVEDLLAEVSKKQAKNLERQQKGY